MLLGQKGSSWPDYSLEWSLGFLSKAAVHVTPAHWVHGLFKGGGNGFAPAPDWSRGCISWSVSKRKLWCSLHAMWPNWSQLVPNSSWIWFHQGRLSWALDFGIRENPKGPSKKAWKLLWYLPKEVVTETVHEHDSRGRVGSIYGAVR